MKSITNKTIYLLAALWYVFIFLTYFVNPENVTMFHVFAFLFWAIVTAGLVRLLTAIVNTFAEAFKKEGH